MYKPTSLMRIMFTLRVENHDLVSSFCERLVFFTPRFSKENRPPEGAVAYSTGVRKLLIPREGIQI